VEPRGNGPGQGVRVDAPEAERFCKSAILTLQSLTCKSGVLSLVNTINQREIDNIGLKVH